MANRQAQTFLLEDWQQTIVYGVRKCLLVWSLLLTVYVCSWFLYYIADEN